MPRFTISPDFSVAKNTLTLHIYDHLLDKLLDCLNEYEINSLCSRIKSYYTDYPNIQIRLMFGDNTTEICSAPTVKSVLGQLKMIGIANPTVLHPNFILGKNQLSDSWIQQTNAAYRTIFKRERIVSEEDILLLPPAKKTKLDLPETIRDPQNNAAENNGVRTTNNQHHYASGDSSAKSHQPIDELNARIKAMECQLTASRHAELARSQEVIRQLTDLNNRVRTQQVANVMAINSLIQHDQYNKQIISALQQRITELEQRINQLGFALYQQQIRTTPSVTTNSLFPAINPSLHLPPIAPDEETAAAVLLKNINFTT